MPSSASASFKCPRREAGLYASTLTPSPTEYQPVKSGRGDGSTIRSEVRQVSDRADRPECPVPTRMRTGGSRALHERAGTAPPTTAYATRGYSISISASLRARRRSFIRRQS
jgi:hypothetical protein